MSHAHITRNQRLSLGTLVRCTDLTQRELADRLGVSQSTISRELSRNRETKSEYGAGWSADRRARARRSSANQCHRKLGKDSALTRYVTKYLKKYWSPEQIAGRMRLEERPFSVSPAAIYEYVYTKRPGLVVFLRLKRGVRKRRYKAREGSLTRFEAAGKRSIEERPPEIEDRSEPGHWEGDTVVGKGHRSMIHTHVERQSGYLLAGRLPVLGAAPMAAVTVAAFKGGVPAAKRKSITYDNGTENQEFRRIEKELRVTTYFAHPYSSCERGTNENTNGLIRQFYPKGTEFDTVEPEQLARTVRLINLRPRKRLGWKTPNEVFKGYAIRK